MITQHKHTFSGKSRTPMLVKTVPPPASMSVIYNRWHVTFTESTHTTDGSKHWPETTLVLDNIQSHMQSQSDASHIHLSFNRSGKTNLTTTIFDYIYIYIYIYIHIYIYIYIHIIILWCIYYMVIYNDNNKIIRWLPVYWQSIVMAKFWMYCTWQVDQPAESTWLNYYYCIYYLATFIQLPEELTITSITSVQDSHNY